MIAQEAGEYISIYKGSVQNDVPPSGEPLSLDQTGAHIETKAEDGENIPAEDATVDKRAFSLVRFMPLLAERVYTTNSAARMHVVNWLRCLDSVPDLELVAWLPDFLDGLL